MTQAQVSYLAQKEQVRHNQRLEELEEKKLGAQQQQADTAAFLAKSQTAKNISSSVSDVGKVFTSAITAGTTGAAAGKAAAAAAAKQTGAGVARAATKKAASKAAVSGTAAAGSVAAPALGAVAVALAAKAAAEYHVDTIDYYLNNLIIDHNLDYSVDELKKTFSRKEFYRLKNFKGSNLNGHLEAVLHAKGIIS